LPNNPSLSPDGNAVAFDWNGDIWVAPTTGGTARQLTQHAARDQQPKFSPDGREIAFVSDRDGTPQVYLIPAAGGIPSRVTCHTAGHALEGWTPDGKKLLVRAARDHYWRHAERFFLISRDGKCGEELVFDDYGQQASLSPDGRKLLFTRESTQWWRKGYHGSQASQVWTYDLDSKVFAKVYAPDRGATWPVWKSDASGFYCASAKNGSFNVHEFNFATGEDRPLTSFADDSVVQLCASADGRTLVFRHLFDLYRFRPGSGEPPAKINIEVAGDRVQDPIERRTLSSAGQVSFSNDGLEIAFTAGGDLWVMDTELREPKRVTTSAEEERDPLFSSDGQAVYFVSDMHGECNVWRAERADKSRYWWQQSEFKLNRLTQDAAVESRLSLSPDGTKLAFVRNRGELMVADADGRNPRAILRAFSPPEYDWSPDGKWIVYAADDNDFNRDIWIVPVDGSKPAFNLSRHPFNENNPVWSPDGKVIAFTGRRSGEEIDVHLVHLRAEDDQTTPRDRTLEKALDKMNRARNAGTRPTADESVPAEVRIDFDGIHDRIRVVSIADSSESGLFWSPNGKRLAFQATVEGRRGTYAIDLPDDLRPKPLNALTFGQPRWLKNNQIVCLANGVPASFAASGGASSSPTRPTAPVAPPAGGPRRGGGAPTAAAATPAPETSAGGMTEYRFTAMQDYDRRQKNAAVFDLAWRTMRDNYYDERLGNRDWDAVRMKYLDAARQAVDGDALATVVNLMLGELNGSHLGFSVGSALRRPDPTATPEPPAGRWTETTGHLGVRFDPAFAGPGLKIRDVLPGGPADLKRSRLRAGDVITHINGQPVNPGTDLARLLTGPPNREISLRVAMPDDKERSVSIRPITFPAARQLLYKQWVENNRKAVDKLSNGRLGYLHIDAMAMPSFYRFEAELYSVGAGKDGLVIDVRENGGGSTADHLLTALCQPVHAITVPRGGGPGYPQDRKVYASWNKPVVVLCNQNSFSNAEIFSHAIKTLKRGQLVGVPTAGGVISTGGTGIMDAGFLRLPFRGWYLLNDGKDMELNGAVPDHVIWPEPGEIPAGKDRQLEKAVEVLQADVKSWQARPQPKLTKASENEPGGKNQRPVVKGGDD